MLRFALSLNKELTLYDLKIALINYIIAMQKNEEFLLLVNDLNSSSTLDKQNIEILKKFSIDTQHIIYESENIKIYESMAVRLLKEQKAFVCFCDKKEDCKCLNLGDKDIKELKEKKEFVIKIKPSPNAIEFKDIIDNKSYSSKVKSFTLLNSKGEIEPIFALSIDDIIYDISTIIKKASNLDSTFKEIYLSRALNIEKEIKYGHLAPIKNDISIKELLKEGFLPDAIINYILLLGYKNPPSKIFYLKDAIKWFDLKNIDNSPTTFNKKELEKINKEHLKQLDSKKLSLIFGFADSDIGELLKLFLNEANTINELDKKLKNIFSLKDCSSNKELAKVASLIYEAPMINNFEEFKEYLLKKSDIDEKRLLEHLKILFTNNPNEPIDLKALYTYLNPYLLEVARCQ